jgi:membrane protein DedA with SNARE-associated domain
MLQTLTQYVASLSSFWFYTALFASAYFENVFPPVPGDTVTVFAGYVAGRSDRSLVGVFISTTLGSAAGFMTYYALGRLIHPEFFVRRNFRFFKATTLTKAGDWFQSYGYWVVLLNRFFSGIRSMISLVCGMYRLPWPRVLLLAMTGCALWNAMLIGAGFILGSNWMLIEWILRQYTRVVVAVVISAALVWLVRRRFFSRAPEM